MNEVVGMSEFFNFIKENGNRVRRVKKKNFYSMIYHYETNYKDEILKYFDKVPLIYVTDINFQKKYFDGINFHHLPMELRIKWFKMMGNESFFNKVVNTLKKLLNIGTINNVKFDKKSLSYIIALWWVKYGIRRYTFKNVRSLHKLEGIQAYEFSKFFTNTFHKASALQREYKSKRSLKNKYKK